MYLLFFDVVSLSKVGKWYVNTVKTVLNSVLNPSLLPFWYLNWGVIDDEKTKLYKWRWNTVYFGVTEVPKGILLKTTPSSGDYV